MPQQDSSQGAGAPVRLAELVAALSVATDLGLGQPMEHVIRSCLVGLRLGEDLGLSDDERAVLYYVGLLAWVGCHADSYELAQLFGDDIAARGAAYGYDLAGSGLARFLLRQLGAGGSLLDRARALGSFAMSGHRDLEQADLSHCVVAGDFARRLGLGEAVHDALQQCFERWDGRGAPRRLRGEEIVMPARIVSLVDTAVVAAHVGGADAAVEVARARRGTEFDPALVDRFCSQAPDLLSDLGDDEGAWGALIASEPGLMHTLDEDGLERALEAVGDFADLKSPWFAGHSRAVADLAGAAAEQMGLAPGEVTRTRRAGFVLDVGRLGVSNAIWDKPGPLGRAEWERVRLHPYLAERVLSRPAVLQEIGALAAMHHERLDGSGYPRGLSGHALPIAARALAVADCYRALLEARPHREALGRAEAEQVLRGLVREGRLDGEAVDAVLAVAGHRVRRRREWPAGLTPREVEVLVLVARGASNKEIGRRLGIATKTAGKHVEHIYEKTGVESRAAASLFAMKQGLLEEVDPAEM